MSKQRLDTILVDLGYFDNKSKAAAAILSGNVKINDEVITKAGFQIDRVKNLKLTSSRCHMFLAADSNWKKHLKPLM